MGAHRADEYRLERRVHHGTARGQVVRRGAGGRGDHHPVGGVAGNGFAIGDHAHGHHAREPALVEHDVVQRPPLRALDTEDVAHARIEGHARLDDVLPGHEPPERLLHLVGGAAGEEAEPPEVDAEDRRRMVLHDARGAQQRAVAAEGEHGVHLAGHDGGRAVAGDPAQGVLVRQRQPERRREAPQRREDAGQSLVAAMPDDAEADHPVSASLPCRARTRSAIPAASSPSSASCFARGAA